MKNQLRKLSLLFIPFMLMGCTGEKKTTNFFSHNIKTIAYNGNATVRLTDPRFNYQYSVEFTTDSEKLFGSITLGGGLAGKTIGDKIAVIGDDHEGIAITLSGNSTNPSATEGTITIAPGAFKSFKNPEYEGFTFVCSFTMGAETEYKDAL